MKGPADGSSRAVQAEVCSSRGRGWAGHRRLSAGMDRGHRVPCLIRSPSVKCWLSGHGIEIEEGSRCAFCCSAPTFWLSGHDQTRPVGPTAIPCVTPLNNMYYWFHATLRRWQGKSTWPWVLRGLSFLLRCGNQQTNQKTRDAAFRKNTTTQS